VCTTVEGCETSLTPILLTIWAVKAKFYYAIQAGIPPAGQLDSVIEVGLSGAMLASWSQTSCEAGRRPAANRSATMFELSRHVEIARTCLRQVRNHAGLRPSRELDSVMEFGLSQRHHADACAVAILLI